MQWNHHFINVRWLWELCAFFFNCAPDFKDNIYLCIKKIALTSFTNFGDINISTWSDLLAIKGCFHISLFFLASEFVWFLSSETFHYIYSCAQPNQATIYCATPLVSEHQPSFQSCLALGMSPPFLYTPHSHRSSCVATWQLKGRSGTFVKIAPHRSTLFSSWWLLSGPHYYAGWLSSNKRRQTERRKGATAPAPRAVEADSNPGPVHGKRSSLTGELLCWPCHPLCTSRGELGSRNWLEIPKILNGPGIVFAIICLAPNLISPQSSLEYCFGKSNRAEGEMLPGAEGRSWVKSEQASSRPRTSLPDMLQPTRASLLLHSPSVC